MSQAELKRRSAEADTEMQQFYSGLTTPTTADSNKDDIEPWSKWAKPQGKGPKWDNNWKWETSEAPTKKEFDQLKELVELMGRALIRHEDELSMRRTESDFILHLDTAEAGILGLFWTASQRWRKMKTEGTLTQSLRLTLFSVLVQEWITRFAKATQDATKQEQMVKMEWVEKGDNEVSWKYLRWNQDNEKLEPAAGGSDIPRRGDATPPRSQEGPLDTRRNSEIPCHKTLSGNVSIAVPCISVECGVPLRTGAHSAQSPNPSERVEPNQTPGPIPSPSRRRPPALVESPGGARAETNTGQSSTNAGSPAVPAGIPPVPILINSGQICYANAVTLMTKWLLQQYNSSHPRPYGNLHAAFTSLKPSQRTNLTTCLPWTTVMRSWFRRIRADMHTQQDAAHSPTSGRIRRAS